MFLLNLFRFQFWFQWCEWWWSWSSCLKLLYIWLEYCRFPHMHSPLYSCKFYYWSFWFYFSHGIIKRFIFHLLKMMTSLAVKLQLWWNFKKKTQQVHTSVQFRITGKCFKNFSRPRSFRKKLCCVDVCHG